MKLKPIEPGMKIHCKNDNELSALLKECEIKGYVWYGTGNKPTKPTLPIDNIICLYDDTYGLNITHTFNESKINTEFSDLVIPELTTEEVFEIMTEMHTECYGKIDGCLGCPIGTVAEHCDADCFGRNAKAIIEVCEQWKADHEKKEPEVEWIFKGVADTAVATEIEFFDTEDVAKEWCERRTIETGLGHAYVPVCRIKAVK